MRDNASIETIMGMESKPTPNGTPTERLISVALWHLGTYMGRYIPEYILLGRVGGSHRALDAAARTMLKRGIIERHREGGVTGCRLSLAYAQPRTSQMIDRPYVPVSKRRSDDVVSTQTETEINPERKR